MNNDLPPAPPGWGWNFHEALDTLSHAYESAQASALENKMEIDKEASEYRKAFAAGMSTDDDEDEWNDHMGAWDEYLWAARNGNDAVCKLVVEAFTMALYHLWERQIKSASKMAIYEADAAFGWLKGNGIEFKAPELLILKLTAETVKHSKGNSAERLFKKRPDLFELGMIPSGAEASYDNLNLRDMHFSQFLTAVRSSGPKRGKMFL